MKSCRHADVKIVLLSLLYLSSDLVNASTWSSVASPLIALYETPVSASLSSSASTLQLQDVSSVRMDANGAEQQHDANSRSVFFISTSDDNDVRSASSNRRLHFRVYEQSSDGSHSLLAMASAPYKSLTAAARSSTPIELPLTNPLSAPCRQALRKFGSTLTLTSRIVSSNEITPETILARRNQVLHDATYGSIPKEVNVDEVHHQQALRLHISTKHLPHLLTHSTDTPTNFIYLVALFERDQRTSNMKLVGMTNWVRPSSGLDTANDRLRIPTAVTADYCPGEQQLFQLSLYRMRHTAPQTMLASDLFTQLSDENRLGSAEFYLDYFSLESEWLQRQRQSGLTASVANLSLPEGFGRIYSTAGHTNLLHMELSLSNDTNTRIDEELRHTAANITITIDTSKYADFIHNPPAPTIEEPMTPKKPSTRSLSRPSHSPSMSTSSNDFNDPPPLPPESTDKVNQQHIATSRINQTVSWVESW